MKFSKKIVFPTTNTGYVVTVSIEKENALDL